MCRETVITELLHRQRVEDSIRRLTVAQRDNPDANGRDNHRRQMDQEDRPEQRQPLQNRPLLIQLASITGIKSKCCKSELLSVLQLQCKLTSLVGYFTPPSRMATLPFLKDILSGRKKLIKLQNARIVVELERYSELTIERLMEYGEQNIINFNDYLPEDIQRPKICRQYLSTVSLYYKVINSLLPGSIERLRIDVIQRSKNRNINNNRDSRIELTQEFSTIISNPIFPLSGSKRLLTGLTRGNQNP